MRRALPAVARPTLALLGLPAVLAACHPRAAFQERVTGAPAPLHLACGATAPGSVPTAEGAVALAVTDGRTDKSPGTLYDARRTTAPIALEFDPTRAPVMVLADDVRRMLAERRARVAPEGAPDAPALLVDLRSIGTDAERGGGRTAVTGRVAVRAALRSPDGIPVWQGDLSAEDTVRAAYVSASTHEAAIGRAYCRVLALVADSAVAPAARAAVRAARGTP